MKNFLKKIGIKKILILLIVIQLVIVSNKNNFIGRKDFLNVQYTAHTIKSVIDLIESEEIEQQQKEEEIASYRELLSLNHFYGSGNRRVSFLYDYSHTLFLSNTRQLLAGDVSSLERLKSYHELLEELEADLNRYDYTFKSIGKVIPPEIMEMNSLGTYYYLTYRGNAIQQRFEGLRELN